MPRPEHFDAVKAILLDESPIGTLVISAIYGMGGIGKSVLASALVQDSEIQMRFPDGVLWVTLGQQPDMLSMVNLWIRELGDYDYNPTTLQAASLHLRILLADQQALLVVDDVWNPEHVEPFRIGGAGCCVLVTTRQTQLDGAREYDLGLMTPKQSLDLLTQCLPNELSKKEQAQAEAFAKEVGYLPLALELAAARIKKGVTWEELLNAFQKEMTVLNRRRNVDSISDETIRKRHSLEASFKLTLQLLSSQELEQFAWLGIVPEDVSLTQEMGATVWNVDPFESGEILREFRDQSLLLTQAQRPGEKPTYRIHDLVHDLAKNLLTHEQYLGELQGLGLTVEQAHAQFLERYRNQAKNGLWHTVPDDGYIHAHLAWHFEQAGKPELLHQLLKESTPEGRNGWYEACERLGQTANFVTDVARAWQAAELLYEQNAIASIALQCRYALITTTLNSLAQNIPPELIAAFVQKGFWKPAQGLAYIRQIQKPGQRANGLKVLAHHLPRGLMSEALEVARTIQSESDRAAALSGLAQYLPESQLSEALAVARTIQDESDRAAALSGLAQYLPESQLSEALAVARTIQDEYSRADALSGLLPQLKIIEIDVVLWCEVMHTLVYQDRKAFVAILPELSPGILSLSGGDKTALKLVVEAMRDICGQWP
ncbi:MAG: NB-ARC domain-containing protein [Cyanobacteria bacterium J06635_15]